MSNAFKSAGVLAVIGLCFVSTAVLGSADLPRDVSEKHWAAASVRVVLQTGVMSAPNGRFEGDRKVTRAELVPILARFARRLEKRQWPTTAAKPLEEVRTTGQWRDRPVTRFEVAAVLDRTGAFAMAGLPAKPAANPTISEAIPPKARVGAVKMSEAARKDLQYLVDRRMIWPGSPLLSGGPEHVTGKQLADAIWQVIAGVNDILTDEPQNREELVRPPRR